MSHAALLVQSSSTAVCAEGARGRVEGNGRKEGLNLRGRERQQGQPVTQKGPLKLNPGAAPFLPLSQRFGKPSAPGSSTAIPGTYRSQQAGFEPKSQAKGQQPYRSEFQIGLGRKVDVPSDSGNDGLFDDDSDSGSSFSDTPAQSTPR